MKHLVKHEGLILGSWYHDFQWFFWPQVKQKELCEFGKMPRLPRKLLKSKHPPPMFWNGYIHPGRLTWNLKITYLKRKIIFQTSIIMFHVSLRGCTLPETNCQFAPGNGWLEYDEISFWGKRHFFRDEMAVSFRECSNTPPEISEEWMDITKKMDGSLF